MAINPNWPVVAEDWGPYWNSNGGAAPGDRYVEVTQRTRGQTSVQRGRQYELDQVRSGEYRTVLVNNDGGLDPLNTAGPWYGHVLPYSPYRKRAQWPPTQNLLTQVQATGGDLGGYPTGNLSSSVEVFSLTDSTGGQIVASATAWQGSNVFQFSVPSGTTAPTRIVHSNAVGVAPGQTYTMQIQVRNVTASTTLQVQPFFGWYTAGTTTPTGFTYGSSVTLTGSSTAAWTQLVVTATAPANAAAMDIGVATAATVSATCSMQVDGWQLEKGGTATTWTQPGVWYPMYAGFTERWPSQWEMSGTYGTVQPTAVDCFALLSQRILRDVFIEEVMARSPRFFYTLSDPQGSTSFTDLTGNFPAMQIVNSQLGNGTITAGTSITSATTGGAYSGSRGSVVTITNPNPGLVTDQAGSYLSLTSAGINGPANPGGNWTRLFGIRYTGPTPSGQVNIWTALDNQRGGVGSTVAIGSEIQLYIDQLSELNIQFSGRFGSTNTYNSGYVINDSNWHLIAISYSHNSTTLTMGVDGTTEVLTPTFNINAEPWGLTSDMIGGYLDPVLGNSASDNYRGDIAFITEFPTALGSTDYTALYNAWKTACSGESTDSRYARILRYAGYAGSSSLQAGQTRSMGPAAIGGQDALSSLQAVVDTENGEHFVDRTGTITFKSRAARYNATAPVYVFGENTAAGEWPYEDCQLDYDSTHLSNIVQITQASTNQLFTGQDTTSIANYFTRTLTRTVNSSSTLECQDAANYLVSRYKNPATRIAALKLHPSANPNLWPVLLSLELGTRVRIMRRPPAPAATIQVDAFVEQIQWDMDDKGEAWVTLQCSPVDLAPYGVFASFHTTLATTIGSGVGSITINAGADNQNPAAAQIGQGQQLVLGLGTANQETVTVQAVAATSPGWTTAVITLQANTTQSHTAGDTVCEQLPTGVTDPTTWDTVSKFDSTRFAY